MVVGWIILMFLSQQRCQLIVLLQVPFVHEKHLFFVRLNTIVGHMSFKNGKTFEHESFSPLLGCHHITCPLPTYHITKMLAQFPLCRKINSASCIFEGHKFLHTTSARSSRHLPYEGRCKLPLILCSFRTRRDPCPRKSHFGVWTRAGAAGQVSISCPSLTSCSSLVHFSAAQMRGADWRRDTWTQLMAEHACRNFRELALREGDGCV